MSASRIDLAQVTDLTEATRWVYDPDKELSVGAALRHVHLEQVTNEKVALTAYATGQVWLRRLAPASGVIGTQYLYDGEDLISRVANQQIWRRSSLRISQNRNGSLKLECVQRIEADGTVVSAGNINLNTYSGDLDDFSVPDASDYVLVAHTDLGYDFKSLARIAGEYSALRGDSANRAVWLCLEQELRLSVTERASDRGIGLLTHTLPTTVVHPIRLGFQGRHLSKIADVVEENPAFTVHVDSIENPTRVRFSGFGGWVDLPVVAEYHCRALSKGAMGVFLGENYTRTESEPVIFSVEQLEDGIAIQAPKKGATRNDVVLELEDQKLLVSKRSDIRRSELSTIPLHEASVVQWLDVVVDHTYLTDAVTALDSFLKAADKRVRLPELTDEPSTPLNVRLVSVTQSVSSSNVHLLLVRPAIDQDYECQVALIVNTKAQTNDYNEAD